MYEEINCLTHQILKSKLFEITLFSLLKKKEIQVDESLDIKTVRLFPSSVLLSGTDSKEKTVQRAAAWSTETAQALDPMEKGSHLSNSTWLQPGLSPWS